MHGSSNIKITVYVSGYTETDRTGMLPPPTLWPFSVAVDINSSVLDFYFLIWSLSRLLCCVGSGFSVATALRVPRDDKFRFFVRQGRTNSRSQVVRKTKLFFTVAPNIYRSSVRKFPSLTARLKKK